MRKIISLLLMLVLSIGLFMECEKKSYNLNNFTEEEVTKTKVEPDGNTILPLFNKIENGSEVEFTGVVTSTEFGYTKKGNKVYFYRIQPVYKGTTLKYTKSLSSGLIVLSPIYEVNNGSMFSAYLDYGDVVSLKGYMVQSGKYYTSIQLIGDEHKSSRWSYIQAEDIEIIENSN